MHYEQIENKPDFCMFCITNVIFAWLISPVIDGEILKYLHI